jgi:Flp pilus assembly protein TadD
VKESYLLMRTKRYQRAEEIAAKIPIKIIFPLVFFILPALVMTLVTPGDIRMYRMDARRSLVMRRQTMSKIFFGCLAAAVVFSGCATSNTTALPKAMKYEAPQRRLLTTEGKKANKAEEAPDTADDCEYLGDLNLQKGDVTTALVNYSRALQLEPNRLSASYKMGRLFLLKGMTAEARGEFEKIIKKDPKNALAHEAMGRTYLLDNNSEKGIEYFTKALDLNERLWEAYNLLGIAYDRQRKFDRAIYHYRAAITLKPDAGAVYNNLGVSYYMNGEYDKAKDAFITALEKGEERSKVYNNLAFTFAQLGNYRAARATLKKVGDEATAQNNLGYLYLRNGKNKEASVAFEKAIELSPTFYREAYENLNMANDALQK